MNVKLQPIQRQSTVEQVVERIRNVIKDQNLSAGQRLPGEIALVEQLQVSRPVLREALARLQAMGLVEIQRGRGTFVASADGLASCVQMLQSAVTLSPRELISYAELRTAIEIQAVRQASLRATSEQVEELQQLLERMESLDCPYSEYLEVDFQFHRKLIEIAGNELMRNVIEVIYEFVIAQMGHTTPTPAENEFGRRLHREIVAGIKSGDPDLAERPMRQHMQIVLDRLSEEAEHIK
ncbi:FadR/GntR family transcriptional regulator [Calycomorphotria hydatis]|uniref:L-lactate dehydrogenase operon regulatory protein n=1 Tax=Calycomorphotria hydatis TaxID=2528027 RepID=A0A517T9W9_9PLAN|nr:FadR/GntR family transcriptional regulator [Calycomorphotria hydatis]QDT65172.1 Putative L-lactate dehydrogenase operon regulatory protein [Calycomorphotria hydatis]